MPAKHIQIIQLREPGPQFFARAAEAFRRLGWEINNYQPDMLFGTKSMNFWSWGEKFYLRQISPGEVEVKCESAIALFDPFGQNKKMIRKLLNAIDNVPPPSNFNPPPPPPTP